MTGSGDFQDINNFTGSQVDAKNVLNEPTPEIFEVLSENTST